MTERTFKLVGTGVPYFMCTLGPTLVFGLLMGQWGTNLIWGHVFGFGWFVAQRHYGPEHWQTAASIGIFIWPPIVLAALWFISRAVWRSGNLHLRAGFMWFLVLSALASVPAQTIEDFYRGNGVPADFNVMLNAY